MYNLFSRINSTDDVGMPDLEELVKGLKTIEELGGEATFEQLILASASEQYEGVPQNSSLTPDVPLNISVHGTGPGSNAQLTFTFGGRATGTGVAKANEPSEGMFVVGIGSLEPKATPSELRTANVIGVRVNQAYGVCVWFKKGTQPIALWRGMRYGEGTFAGWGTVNLA